MVVADDGQDVRSRRERLDDAFADDRVRAHLPFFLGIQRSGLTQDCVGHRDFPDVVDEAAAIQRNQIRFLKAESGAEVKGGTRYPLGMAFGVGILRLRGGCQRDDDLFRTESNWQPHRVNNCLRTALVSHPIGTRPAGPKIDGFPSREFRCTAAP
jgi:hypothetical protein